MEPMQKVVVAMITFFNQQFLTLRNNVAIRISITYIQHCTMWSLCIFSISGCGSYSCYRRSIAMYGGRLQDLKIASRKDNCQSRVSGAFIRGGGYSLVDPPSLVLA